MSRRKGQVKNEIYGMTKAGIKVDKIVKIGAGKIEIQGGIAGQKLKKRNEGHDSKKIKGET